MKIHRAGNADTRAIFSLIDEATKRGRILKRPHSEIVRSLHHFWVAEKDGKVVGCCAIEFYNKKLAEVRSLAVDTHHEGQGIASALVSRCLREAKKRKIYEVLVITDRESIFKRLGFAEQLHGQKALFLRP